VGDFHAHRRFGFGASLAQDGVGREGFAVNLGDEKRVLATVFFPDLADLDFANGHSTNVVRFLGTVNMRNPL